MAGLSDERETAEVACREIAGLLDVEEIVVAWRTIAWSCAATTHIPVLLIADHLLLAVRRGKGAAPQLSVSHNDMPVTRNSLRSIERRQFVADHAVAPPHLLWLSARP